MKTSVEFEIHLDEAGVHGREWTLTVKSCPSGQVSLTVRSAAGAVQCHGQERSADFQRMAQLLAAAK